MTPQGIRLTNGTQLQMLAARMAQALAPLPRLLPWLWGQASGGFGRTTVQVMAPGAPECPSQLIHDKDLNNFCGNVMEVHITQPFA